MPLTAVLAAALLGGCELVSFHRNETAGIGALELVPLYFQEKQYVTDRDLEAKVRAALAAQGLQHVESTCTSRKSRCAAMRRRSGSSGPSRA